jgi:hypothetical protein
MGVTQLNDPLQLRQLACKKNSNYLANSHKGSLNVTVRFKVVSREDARPLEVRVPRSRARCSMVHRVKAASSVFKSLSLFKKYISWGARCSAARGCHAASCPPPPPPRCRRAAGGPQRDIILHVVERSPQCSQRLVAWRAAPAALVFGEWRGLPPKRD